MTKSSRPVVEARALGKWYAHRPGPLQLARNLFGIPAPESQRSHALVDIDLSLGRGEGLVVVGRNGSGKTTLLRVLGSVLPPSCGALRVDGRVASLIDLGAGIDPEFSGRDNAVMLGLLAGQSSREIEERLDPICAFSGLEHKFEEPVKTYSTGMTMRLAFSVATLCEPEVLLIDEVLAVGDALFQQRCLRRVRELREGGCTTVLVTHDPAAATRFSEQAIWLDGGRIAARGDTAGVLREYLGALYEGGALRGDSLATGELRESTAEEVVAAIAIPNVDHRYGSGRARITGIETRDAASEAATTIETGELLRVVVTVLAEDPVASPVVGFSLRDRLGEIVTATNTAHEERKLPSLAAGDELSVEFRLPWPPLAAGAYSISPAIADGDLQAHSMCDWIDNAAVIHATNASARYGSFSLSGVDVLVSFSGSDPS